MRRVDAMEAELRLFWRMSKEAREAARSPDETDMAEHAEELMAFGNHVESPTLRTRCMMAAADLAPPGRNVVHA